MAHFAGGEFGHDGDFDVGEASIGAFVGGDAGEGPCGSFVVHDAAGAVDGVDDDADLCGLFGSAVGEGAVGDFVAEVVFEALGDEDQWRFMGPFFAEFFEYGVDLCVDGVNGVGGGISHDGGQRLPPPPVRLADGVTDHGLELLEAGDDGFGIFDGAPFTESSVLSSAFSQQFR